VCESPPTTVAIAVFSKHAECLAGARVVRDAVLIGSTVTGGMVLGSSS